MQTRKLILALFVLVLCAGTALAQTPVLDPGWETFVIRNSSSGDDSPTIFYHPGPPDNSIEFDVPLGGQKAGLGTNLINGATISQIATLHIDRIDGNVAAYPYGPYFNIWVTDGSGNYAVIANEPSNTGEWGGDPWDISDWDDLRVKTCKVYETPGWNTNSSWVHTHVGHGDPLVFEDIADLVISPPPPAYIQNGANGVGSGAPDVLGTDVAYGYNWVFGDTQSNYAGAYIVNGYSATANFPVHNLTQDTYYAGLQAAIDDAVAGEVIQIEAASIAPAAQVIVDKDLTIQGLGSGMTTIAAGFNTSGGAYTTTLSMIYVDYGVTAVIKDLTIDGSGYSVSYGVQSRGASLTVEDCVVSNIMSNTYEGRGLVFLTGNGYVNSCVMTDIQRIGVHIRGGAIGEPSPYVEVDGLNYTGKGPGDWLDYSIEFGGGGQGTVFGSSAHACVGVAAVDGSTSAGILVTDYYGTGTMATITGCSLNGNSTGVAVGFAETDMSQVTISGCDLSGNPDYGISSTGPEVMAEGNYWGDVSGPNHPGKNPGGTGVAVDDHVDFTPWTGRTTTVVADLAFGPSYPVLVDDGYGFWEGTPGIGLDDDYATGFAPGAIQAPNAYVKYGFAPEAVFGRDVNVGELYSITYHTKKDTDHSTDAADWFLQMYTDAYTGSPGGWYGDRINSEPYFSENLTETPGEWTQWNTDAGENNRLRFFDSNINFGSYTDGFLDDLTNDPAYTNQPIYLFGTGLGTGWASTFDGLVDGLTIELVSGEIATVNFMSGDGEATIDPVATGPVACGQDVTLTVNLTTDAATPDVFGFSAVVRASSELSFSAVTDLEAFGTDTQFWTFDNLDGSYLISGTTIGDPSQPISGPGTTPLFSVTFTAQSDGVADITFDQFTLRDPDNNPIGATNTGATIEVDCTDPPAVTDIAVAPAPTSTQNGAEVSWTMADASDVDHYEIWRAVWHTGDDVTSAYPEYDDDNPLEPVRAADYAGLVASAEWTQVSSTVAGTATSFTDLDAPRGVYYYEVIAVDAVAYTGPLAAANDRATNYYLGDFDYDGQVEGFDDVNTFGAAFGTQPGHANWDNEVDIGPTDTNQGLGIPATDNWVNFEDLMIFSLNYGVFGAKSGTEISPVADLAWISYGNDRYGLRLVDASGLKGVHLRASLPEGADVTVLAGELLDAQSDPTFLRNVGLGLDVNVAVLGSGVGFTGQGDLLVVESSAPLTAEDLILDLRGADNSDVEVNLTSESGTLTPRVFGLYPNFPNPFNPMTKISFSLPEEQAVRLNIYGVDGKLVRTLVNETRGSGLHEVLWDGRSDGGQMQASGLYFYRIEAGPYSQVRKMTLMK